MQPSLSPRKGALRPTSLDAILLPVAALVLCWVYWPTLAELAGRWGHDSRYSHGYLVPLFSLYLLWARRGQLGTETLRPSGWGLLLIGLGLTTRLAGTFFFYTWLSAASLLPCLAGLFVLWGGGRALRWSWPAVAFLVFMLPLPYQVEVALAHPLQRVATLASTYALQTLGFAAYSEGNVISLGESRIGVKAACSGLSMMLIFFALSTAIAMVCRRPPLERSLIFVSAIPIALLANFVRILVTAVLHKTVGGEVADYVFHDLAGWLMMPLALGMLWAELGLLSCVLVPAPSEDAQALDLAPWLPQPTTTKKEQAKAAR
jgi:exosortase